MKNRGIEEGRGVDALNLRIAVSESRRCIEMSF